MTCIRCQAPSERVLCPRCVSRMCCTRSRRCIHTEPARRRVRFAVAALAAAGLVAGCAGGGPHEEVGATPSPGRPYPMKSGVEVPETTTTTTAPPPPTTRAAEPRASRQQQAPRRPTAAGAPAAGDLLDALARCESGGNPQAVGGGGRYFGSFQFALSTWRNVTNRLGLGHYSADPRDHSYAEQRDVVARGIPVSSWGRQFPHCARRLGVA